MPQSHKRRMAAKDDQTRRFAAYSDDTRRIVGEVMSMFQAFNALRRIVRQRPVDREAPDLLHEIDRLHEAMAAFVLTSAPTDDDS